jgi:hypothetical protein
MHQPAIYLTVWLCSPAPPSLAPPLAQVAELTHRLSATQSELARARQEYRANDIIAIGLRDQIYRLRQQLAAANSHIQAQVGCVDVFTGREGGKASQGR